MSRNRKRICIIGSGNWGTVFAKIIGNNVTQYAEFEDRVTMYVYEEVVGNRNLTDIMNEDHVNTKYLAKCKIPPNVIAMSDVTLAAKDADIIVFAVPQRFVRSLISALLGKIKRKVFGISFVKGFDVTNHGELALMSAKLSRRLHMPCACLMGHTFAREIVEERYSEATLGCFDPHLGRMFQKILQTAYFRVYVVEDQDAVEVLAGLKNIVACAAGFMDGLDMGYNTKGAILRLGLIEMVKFIELFYSHCKLSTFFENCGINTLMLSCILGRERRMGEAFVKTKKPLQELEELMLNGRPFPAKIVAAYVNKMLTTKNMEKCFPLFTAVHKVCIDQIKVTDFIDQIRSSPEHLFAPKNLSLNE